MSSEFPNPHERSFGVEIECGLPGGYERACELFDYDHYYDEDQEDFNRWSVGEDGTEVEIRTPVLRGEKGFKTLRDAMQTIRDAGGYVTPQDGLHVHHGAPELVDNAELCNLLVKSWKNNEGAIHDMVAPRRRTSMACPTWGPDALNALDLWLKGSTSYLYAYRNDLNLVPLTGYGTIEIRLHEGTLDPEVAISWIKFFQVFLNEILDSAEELAPIPVGTDILSSIRLAPEAAEALMRKRMNSYLTPDTSFRPRSERRDEDW